MAEKYETITVDEFKRQFLLLDSRLKSYPFRLTANRHDAEDLTQETYLKALQNLRGFAGKSTLKTWFFTIATNLAKDHFKPKHSRRLYLIQTNSPSNVIPRLRSPAEKKMDAR